MIHHSRTKGYWSGDWNRLFLCICAGQTGCDGQLQQMREATSRTVFVILFYG
jgi:hypothetical protein